MDGEKRARGMLGFRCRKRLVFSDPKPATLSDAKPAVSTLLGSRKRVDNAGLGGERKSASPELKNAPADLPEKYALLEAFYEGVEGAISLLGIRRELCTFQAVCAAVEATTKRRFLQKHLAQIKYLLPEAVELEYVRLYESDTRSNKWELKVSLWPLPAEVQEAVEEGEGAAKRPKVESMQRRRLFHARLVEFASSHSEGDDVPAHPMPERNFNGSSASHLTSAGFSMPVATTCISMDINSSSHRAEPKSERSPAVSSHFSKSFSSCFSLKGGGSFIRSAKRTPEVSPAGSDQVRDTVLPMPINRTKHRDVHKVADMPNGTPHLVQPFKPYFSIKGSLPDPELVTKDCDDSVPVTSVHHTLLDCRHKERQEEPEIVEPVELQTPVKVTRSSGILRSPSASEYESPNKRPHFSPAFKAQFSVSSTRQDPSGDTSSSNPSTPVKRSIPKEAPISGDVRTPGRMDDAVDQCFLVDEEFPGLKTPLKSSIPPHFFRYPAPVTLKKHQHSPCTPQVTECRESSIYSSFHASELESGCHDGFKSPCATPVRQVSAMRSLFGPPESGSGVTGPPSVDVPLTSAVQTRVNASRGSNLQNMGETKQPMGSLFDWSGDVEIDCGVGEESSSIITPASVAGERTLRKSLSLASEVSQADTNLIRGLPAELVHS